MTPAIMFDSFCQNFVDRNGFLQIVEIGAIVQLDDDNKTVVEIVAIDNCRDGDTLYTCEGLQSEYQGSPGKLFVPN